MRAYRITVDNSDYPYLVIANSTTDAIYTLLTNGKHHVTDNNITGITYLSEYTDKVIIEKEDETK